MSAALEISKIDAGYGSLQVLHDVSFDVQAGETFGLIGLNGAGKTTLIKIILGLKDQLSGSITVSGHKAGTEEAKRHTAYLPERFDPAWFLTAYEFIKFTLSLYKRAFDKPQADAMAEKLALKHTYLSKRAQTYSKGMRQKLGLISTFMTGSALLVLDEPMSGLDPLARAQVKNLVAEARADGRTVFLSSHILSDMEEMCDRIAVLHGGKILFIGKPSVLLAAQGKPHLEQAFLSLIETNQANAA
jgi:ABC-2 type transport system ATP-binding protein